MSLLAGPVWFRFGQRGNDGIDASARPADIVPSIDDIYCSFRYRERPMKKMILFALALLSSSYVFAHGFVASPPSRSDLCAPNRGSPARNSSAICGNGPRYDPMSLEGAQGFPGPSVPDGMIASASPVRSLNHNLDFSRLNIQTSDQWARTDMQPGPNTFTWFITMRHPTRRWEYFITNQNWDQNAPLTRASFGATPFCSQIGSPPPTLGLQQPVQCNVPVRTGYQIILAIWTIADTPFAFYQVIDVNFPGGSVTPPPVNPPPVTPPPVNPPPVIPPPGNAHRINTQQQVNAIDSGASNNPNPNGINNFRNLLQANQSVEISMQPRMWLHNLVFPAATQVPAGRTILFSNRIGWNLTVTINGANDQSTIANGQDARFVVQNGRWVRQ
jgi:predicted carbohydrate-binding protein with CBM5 and CBM33 domain